MGGIGPFPGSPGPESGWLPQAVPLADPGSEAVYEGRFSGTWAENWAKAGEGGRSTERGVA